MEDSLCFGEWSIFLLLVAIILITGSDVFVVVVVSLVTKKTPNLGEAACGQSLEVPCMTLDMRRILAMGGEFFGPSPGDGLDRTRTG